MGRTGGRGPVTKSVNGMAGGMSARSTGADGTGREKISTGHGRVY
jgi:hypothetical protein